MRNSTLLSRLESALNRVLYVEHPMRTGGSTLCHTWCHRWNCSFPMVHERNCRLLQGGQVNYVMDFRLRSQHIGWDYPEVTERLVQHYFTKTPELCGLVMNEPTYAMSRGATMARFERPFLSVAPFWTAYTTIFLVRDPLERFLSHVTLTCRNNLTSLPWTNGGPKSCSSGGKLTSIKRLFDFHTLREFGGADYFTYHLVPRFERGYCDEFSGRLVLQHAIEAVNAFDLVLNVADLPRETTLILHRFLSLEVSAKIGQAESGYRTRRMSHLGGASVSDESLERFSLANRCDIALVSHANSRVRALAALAQQSGVRAQRR